MGHGEPKLEVKVIQQKNATTLFSWRSTIFTLGGLWKWSGHTLLFGVLAKEDSWGMEDNKEQEASQDDIKSESTEVLEEKKKEEEQEGEVAGEDQYWLQLETPAERK